MMKKIFRNRDLHVQYVRPTTKPIAGYGYSCTGAPPLDACAWALKRGTAYACMCYPRMHYY